ncbi:MAG: glycosyltransferase family 2 protein [Candidatus Aenigmarchaeota archaeon]|nr:glycosyltransferase family 2 protein [Candidatus Aenigmarchaeota archaeon]
MSAHIIAVIPAYNEEKTITEAIRRTKKHVDRVVVVDDGSMDNTALMAKKEGAIVVQNPVNMGVGTSKRLGIQKALGLGADLIVTLDADLQHQPEDIPRFIEKLGEGYSFVLGRRDISKYPFVKKFGNFGLNILTNILAGTGFRLMDTESGFKAFTRDAALKMDLTAERYAIEAEIAYEVGKNKIPCATIEIDSPRYRKGVTVMHGFRNFWFLLGKKVRDA